MSDHDERAAWEASELAGLARQQGAKRVEVEPGVWAWQFPPYYCPHCTAGGDLDALPLPDCPQPLARHGPITPWQGPVKPLGFGMTEQERRELRDQMEARGWHPREEEYEGELVLTLPAEGKPGRLIIKSPIDAIFQGYISASDRGHR